MAVLSGHNHYVMCALPSSEDLISCFPGSNCSCFGICQHSRQKCSKCHPSGLSSLWSPASPTSSSLRLVGWLRTDTFTISIRFHSGSSRSLHSIHLSVPSFLPSIPEIEPLPLRSVRSHSMWKCVLSPQRTRCRARAFAAHPGK